MLLKTLVIYVATFINTSASAFPVDSLGFSRWRTILCSNSEVSLNTDPSAPDDERDPDPGQCRWTRRRCFLPFMLVWDIKLRCFYFVLRFLSDITEC